MKKVMSVVLNNFKNDSRVLKECISLQNNGYQVSVLALFDNYIGLPEYDNVDNVSVHRIRLISKSWPKILLIQIIKYLEFVFRATIESFRADIIHCNDLDALPVGVFCKILSLGKIKIVYDAHELETERDGIYGGRRMLLKISERLLIGFVDKMMTVSDGIADEYVSQYDIEKPLLILNSPSKKNITKNNVFRDEFNIGKQKKIMLYQGVVSEGNGIRLIVNAFKQLKHIDVVLVVMGYGPLENWVKEQAKKYDNIFFHDAVSPNILLDYTASADYGLACIDGSGSLSYYYTLPNKLFEYSMCKLPTIISSLPEMIKYNEKYNFGVVCEYTEKSFEAAVQDVINRDYCKLQRGAQAMAYDCCWEVQEKKLINLYKGLEVSK